MAVADTTIEWRLYVGSSGNLCSLILQELHQIGLGDILESRSLYTVFLPCFTGLPLLLILEDGIYSVKHVNAINLTTLLLLGCCSPYLFPIGLGGIYR